MLVPDEPIFFLDTGSHTQLDSTKKQAAKTNKKRGVLEDVPGVPSVQGSFEPPGSGVFGFGEPQWFAGLRGVPSVQGSFEPPGSGIFREPPQWPVLRGDSSLQVPMKLPRRKPKTSDSSLQVPMKLPRRKPKTSDSSLQVPIPKLPPKKSSGIRKFREPPRSPVLKGSGIRKVREAVRSPFLKDVPSLQAAFRPRPKKSSGIRKVRQPLRSSVLKGGPSPQYPPSLYMPERSIDLEDWIEDKFLGSGAYGEVYRYTHRYTEEVLAVKKVNIQPLYAERDANVKGLKLRNEIDILKKLRHERIVAYHQSVEKEKHLYLFMDYMTGGSLRDKIKSQIQGVLSEDLSRNYTQQILEGVCYLHSQHIVHRDIKGDNVLLDDNGNVKLADFGLARKFEKIGSKTNLVSHVGTPYWMAPEVILGKPYGRKADNWSVGCTVVEMMTGRAPLGHMEPLAAMFRVGSQTFEPESVKGASLVANNFIRVALTWDPKDRPQSHELLKHQFICGSTVTREDHEKQASTLNREDEEKLTSTVYILVD